MVLIGCVLIESQANLFLLHWVRRGRGFQVLLIPIKYPVMLRVFSSLFVLVRIACQIVQRMSNPVSIVIVSVAFPVLRNPRLSGFSSADHALVSLPI
jgi:hypothetical protein